MSERTPLFALGMFAAILYLSRDLTTRPCPSLPELLQSVPSWKEPQITQGLKPLIKWGPWTSCSTSVVSGFLIRATEK